MPHTTLRVALLGSGNSARTFHAPFIRALPELWTLHAVFERGATPGKSRAREQFGDQIKVYSTLEDTLSDADVDVVVVCAATAVHFEYTRQALLAGKHAIVEKPFTPTSQEAQELLDLAASRNLVVIPYQNRRFDADFLTVKKLLKEGQIPNVIDFESRYDCNVTWNLGPSIPGSGITWAIGTHTVDQAVHLFGAPSTVYADCWNARGLGDPAADDSCNLLLRYDDKPLRVLLRVSTFSTVEPQLRFLVRGTDASFVKYGLDVQESQINAGVSPLDPRFGEEDASVFGQLSTSLGSKSPPGPYLSAKSHPVKSEKGDYLAFYANAARAIVGLEEPIVSVAEVVTSLQVIEAAIRSNASGNTERIR